MAPNVPKSDTKKKDKRKENGVFKPTSRQATMAQKNLLNNRKNSQSQHRDSQRKQLKDLQKKINATKALMSEEEDEEKLSEIEVSLKELLSSSKQIESELKIIESDIMDIDKELKEGPMDVDDTEDENNGDGPDNESESPESSDRDQQNGSPEISDQDQQNESTENSDRGQQNELAAKPKPEIISNGSSLSSTADAKYKDLNDTNISQEDLASQQPSNESHPVPDVVVNSNDLFIGKTERSSTTQAASQQDHERPKDYKDYPFIDLTLDDDDGPSEQLFENGTVTLKKNARSGSDYLNSYGPLNCAMTIWSSNAASNEVEECTYLKGHPHKEAMLEDKTGKALYKGMIRDIKKVAWQPRREGSTMLDLLESVEELNPEVKKTNPKYTFPFTTVLVDWKKGANLPPLWISRTNYKLLTSSAKKESLRTDRRIYAVALVQVKHYRNWAGKLLDNNWTGEKRVGLAQSPTPFPQTLETEQILLRGRDDQVKNKKSDDHQDHRTQGPSIEHNQEQGSESKSAHDQGNGASPTNLPQSTNKDTVAHEKKSERSPQPILSREEFLDQILSMIKNFDKDPLDKQMEARTSALAYYSLYERKMKEGGATEVKV